MYIYLGLIIGLTISCGDLKKHEGDIDITEIDVIKIVYPVNKKDIWSQPSFIYQGNNGNEFLPVAVRLDKMLHLVNIDNASKSMKIPLN